MTEEDWELTKLRDLQTENRKDQPVQQLLIHLPSLRPKKAIGQRIGERMEQYSAKLKDNRTSKDLLWKVARAVEEGRVEEARIERIWPSLEIAHNRGAYFVASAKAAFKSVNLSWLEEEWEDA